MWTVQGSVTTPPYPPSEIREVGVGGGRDVDEREGWSYTGGVSVSLDDPSVVHWTVKGVRYEEDFGGECRVWVSVENLS